MQGVILSSCVLLGGILLLTHFQQTESSPLNNKEEYIGTLNDDADARLDKLYLLDLLFSLEQDLLARKDVIDPKKRGMDFGVGRGFSGAEMAKHKLGMAAANNPWGPGRRRRSPDESQLPL